MMRLREEPVPYAEFIPRVLGGIAAYVGLAFVIYILYYSFAAGVYDSTTHEGLVAQQAIFYVAFGFHVLASLAISVRLAPATGAARQLTLVLSFLSIAGLAFVTLGFLSFANLCLTDVSFPFPGEGGC